MEWMTLLTILSVGILTREVSFSKRKFGVSVSWILILLLFCGNLAYARGISGIIGGASEGKDEDPVGTTLGFLGTSTTFFQGNLVQYDSGTSTFFIGKLGGSYVTTDISAGFNQGPSNALAGYDDVFITSTGTWLRADDFVTGGSTPVTIDRSVNSGVDWTNDVLSEQVAGAHAMSSTLGALRSAHFGEDLILSRLWFSFNGKIAYSDDDGATWTIISEGTCTGGEGIAANNGKIVIGDYEDTAGCSGTTGNSVRALVSLDNGASWTVIDETSCSGNGCSSNIRRWYHPIILKDKFYMIAYGSATSWLTEGGFSPTTSWSAFPEVPDNGFAYFGGYETNKAAYIYAAARGDVSQTYVVSTSQVPVTSWTDITGDLNTDIVTRGCSSGAFIDGTSSFRAVGTTIYVFVRGEHYIANDCNLWYTY